MIKDIHISFFDPIIFLGIFQGLFLSWFFIKNSQSARKANLFQGLLLFSLSAVMFEELLNNTGYITRLLALSNFAEPLNFVIGPLFYLYIKYTLRPNEKGKDWIHFLVFFFYLAYMSFYYLHTNEYKYNSYIDSKHPDWPFLKVYSSFSDDPVGIRKHVTELTAIHLLTYISFAIGLLLGDCDRNKIKIFRTDNVKIKILRNTCIHFVIVILIIIIVKTKFQGDVGDYFISSYVSFMIISTGYRIIGDSTFFDHASSFLDFPLIKYKKSSLSEEAKSAILKKIEIEFGVKGYCLNSMASLNEMSKNLKESPHHVSQVINEKLKMNFFELLAKYRVEEAKKILIKDKDKKITIEEVAEQVGYNSKSAFNNAFKKITFKTPSEFRESPDLN